MSKTFDKTLSGVANLRDALTQQEQQEKDAVASPFQFDDLIVAMEPETGMNVVTRAPERFHMIERDVFTIGSTTLTNIPTSFATPSTQITFQLKKDQGVGLIRDVKARVKLSATGAAVTPLNLFMLFTSIEIWIGQGREKIQTLYPETMYHYYLNYFTKEQRDALDDYMNVSGPNYQNEETIASGATNTYIIPLFGNWIEQSGGLYLPSISEEIWIIFNLRTTPVKSGAGTLGLAGFVLLYDEQMVSPTEEAQLKNMWDTSVLEKNYIDTQKVTITDSFTNGIAWTKQVTALRGKAHGVLMTLRTPANAAPLLANNGYLKTLDLGTNTGGFAIDITNAAGYSLVGNNPWWPDISRGFNAAKYFPGTYPHLFKNWYFLTFGDSMAAEEKAIRKGWFSFTGEEYWKITPGSAGAEVGEVYTIGAGGGTTGNFRFEYNGKSTPWYAFGIGFASVLPDINSFLLADTLGYDGTPIIATLTTGTNIASTPTITFTNVPKGGMYAKGTPLQIVISGENGITTCQMSTQSVPQSGAATLSTTTCQLDIWAKMYRHCHIDRGTVKMFTSQPF